MPANRLNRRTVLRGILATGAVATLPIPILECMLNSSGTAYAAGAALPQRFATWFFGNGILYPLWNPASTGSGDTWKLSQELAPLSAVKDQLTVISGLANKIPNCLHPGGSAGATTGAGVVSKSAVLPSIDQIVAGAIGKNSTFQSVELGVSNATPNGSENTLHAISHRGKNAPNYPEFDPHAAFTRLFGKAVATSTDPNAAKKTAAEKSVLDAVVADASELSSQLGATDKQRLDQHLDGIRQLELQLANTGTCNAPTDPTTKGVLIDKKSEAPSTVNEVMADLLSIAFACNLTKVASLVFTLPAAHVYYRGLGTDMNDDFHDVICHTDAGDSGHQTRVDRGVIYAMGCLATFLQKLSKLPEGAGSVLDNSLVYVTSDIGWGKVHQQTEWPVILAGKAGGALKGNQHLRFPGDNLSKVMFSAANIMGAKVTSFGANEGLVTTGLTGLTA